MNLLFIKDNQSSIQYNLILITLIQIYDYYGLFTLERNTYVGGERLKEIALEREMFFFTSFGAALPTFLSLHSMSAHADSPCEN